MIQNKPRFMQVYFFVFYMGIGLYTTYITIYLKSAGLTSSAIGTITGVGPLVSMLGLAVAGKISDQTGKMNAVLSVSFLLSAVCALLIPVFPIFTGLLVTNVMYTLCSSPLLQLSDGLSMNLCNQFHTPFNRVKLWGTMGYAFTILAAGYVFQSGVSYMFGALAGIFVLSAVLVFFIPDNREVKGGGKATALDILKNRKICLLYTVNLLVYIPISYYNSFFPILIQSFAPERLELVSWASFLALIAEFPFLLCARFLQKKLGNKRLMLLSCFLMTVRWLVIALAPNVAVVIGANLLKGASDIVFAFCSTDIVCRVLSDRLKGSGQAFLGIMCYGIARILGNWGGGILTDVFSIRTIFLYGALLPVFAGFLIATFDRFGSKKAS